MRKTESQRQKITCSGSQSIRMMGQNRTPSVQFFLLKWLPPYGPCSTGCCRCLSLSYSHRPINFPGLHSQLDRVLCTGLALCSSTVNNCRTISVTALCTERNLMTQSLCQCSQSLSAHLLHLVTLFHFLFFLFLKFYLSSGSFFNFLVHQVDNFSWPLG